MGNEQTIKQDRVIGPPRHPAQYIVLDLGDRTLLLLESLLASERATQATLKRIEKEIKAMAIKFDKLDAAVAKIGVGQEALTASFAEIVAEFDALKSELTDIPAAQAKIDAFGDSLGTFADSLAAQAQAFKDINPNTPPTP